MSRRRHTHAPRPEHQEGELAPLRALDIARGGLKARARPGLGGMVQDERHFLHALEDSIENGKVPSDELLDRYNGDWAGDLSKIYGEYSY